MKPFILFFSILLFCLNSNAQTNCTLFTDSNCARACRLYNEADKFYQGSRMCQYYLDSAMRLCPGYAEAWHEFSVPFLKRGDFFTWRKYMDKAVALKPRDYLGTRGWCRFKFLRDYEGALDDLKRYDTITQFNPGQSGDGIYNLYIIMALCERELGNYTEAFYWFSKGIDSIYNAKGIYWIGFYDYVHRAVTRIKMNDYAGALADLEKQRDKNDKYAEAWYYKGVALQLTGRKQEAKSCYEKAKQLYVAGGYHFTDTYCEILDAVYLSDIVKALKNL
jgi:tetratricopeptide (TPR) repeat protein